MLTNLAGQGVFVRKKNRYTLSLEAAMAAVKEMNPKSFQDYIARRHEYEGLPASPSIKYGAEYPGWKIFKGEQDFYPTIEEAKAAVSRMGIESFIQYKQRSHEDPRLPLNPRIHYGQSYKGAVDFYGKPNAFYQTVAEASQAAIGLGIHNSREYGEVYNQDSFLPRHPDKAYEDEWPGWPSFLGYEGRIRAARKYKTYAEFEKVIREMGVKNQTEYNQKRHSDPLLPARPADYFGEAWPGWAKASGLDDSQVCETWEEARKVAAQYCFSSKVDYKARCGVDERLPTSPESRYKKNFPKWGKFLLPETYETFFEFRCAVRYLKVYSARHYESVRKKYPGMPSDPPSVYASEWTTWEDVLGTDCYYGYEQLSEMVQSNNHSNMREYRGWVRKLNNARMPLYPEKVYEEWDNAHKFLNRVEPYSLAFVEEELRGWVPSIREWLVGTRSATQKETSLCRVLRHFIGPYKLGNTPHEFLFKSGVDVKPFKELLEQQVSRVVARGILRHTNEFLNGILKNELTVEDYETGEKVRVNGASNPFAYLDHAVINVDAERPGQTVKPALAYQYVERLKKWIVPETAKNFSDLTSIHNFDADYIEVDESLIDPNDPDCVFKVVGGRHFLWFPVYWMHTYALVSIPARGRQIAYNDSGETDDYIADIVDEKLVWVKNTGKLAGWKNPLAQARKSPESRKAFVQMGDNGWAMSFTSNKTSFNGAGYKVDWAPDTLVYWMVKLRKWQEKYNPITAPFPWEKCTRTQMNLAQRVAKGANCFLFREFGGEEPPAYSNRLSERLAAALYYSQPADIVLATFLEGGSEGFLSHYDSKYTPHSMRVSLITAYVMEFGLPIEVIMKLAGHSSIVMSIYYVKVGGVALRRRMDEGEKRALQEESYAAQDMIEQGRIDALRHQLVSSSEQALEMLRAGYTGSTLVRDYGLCPYAAGRCDDGGPLVGGTHVRLPAPNGYLGMQNCPRCRHFITGPMFLGGLLSLWNEISLRMTFLSEHYQDFESQIDNLELQVQQFDEQEYDVEQAGGEFDGRARHRARVEIRKLQSEQESTAKKMDLFLCDLQALNKHVTDCRELIGRYATNSEEEGGKLMLVVHEQHEIVTDIESTSLFQQLHEVCVNATIYQSATADFAVPRRSLMLDKMALMNDLRPAMCNLTDKEQLVLGNQVTNFLFSRVQSWERVDRLVEGTLRLADLTGTDRIEKEEIQKLLDSKPLALGPLAQSFASSIPQDQQWGAPRAGSTPTESTLIYRSGREQTPEQEGRDVRYAEIYDDEEAELLSEDDQE